MSGLSVVPQRCRRRRLWRGVSWSFRRALRTSPWHAWRGQIEVCPSRRLVVGSPTRRLRVKFCSTSRVTVEVSTVVSPRLVVVRTTARVKVVSSTSVVTPFRGVGWAAWLARPATAQWRTSGCIARCAVCFYEFDLQQT